MDYQEKTAARKKGWRFDYETVEIVTLLAVIVGLSAALVAIARMGSVQACLLRITCL